MHLICQCRCHIVRLQLIRKVLMRCRKLLFQLLVLLSFQVLDDLVYLVPLLNWVFHALKSVSFLQSLVPILTVWLRLQETGHQQTSHHRVGALGECKSISDLYEGAGSHMSAFTLSEKSVENWLESKLQRLFEVVCIGCKRSKIVVCVSLVNLDWAVWGEREQWENSG